MRHCVLRVSEILVLCLVLRNTSQHQFWVPHEVEEEVENKELSAQMKSRYITFAGHFQPVEHKCKSPMPNGSLCERQDRVKVGDMRHDSHIQLHCERYFCSNWSRMWCIVFKCPFHGLIIPRDEIGRPINPEDAARLEREEYKRREEQPGGSYTSNSYGWFKWLFFC